MDEGGEMRVLLILAVLFLPAYLVAVQQQPESARWLQVNWEREKFEKGIPTDTIFIHHTALPSGITLKQLSELQHRLVYVPVFATQTADPDVKGQEPYSGHFQFVDGKLTQVFYAYHWLVRTDGTAVRLLQDTEVGWHAGNWSENLRSVAICLDGDFSKAEPSKKMLETTAKLIADYSKSLPIKRLKAHYDLNPRRKVPTECPGLWFDAKNKKGSTGRDRLIEKAHVQLARE